MANINQAYVTALHGGGSSGSSAPVSEGKVKVVSGVVGQGGGIYNQYGENLSVAPPVMTRKDTVIPATRITGSPYIGSGQQVQVSSYNPIIDRMETSTEIVPGTTGIAGGGLIYVTPAEKQRLAQTTLPIWKTETPNTPAGMAQAINVESKFAATVNPSQVGAPITSTFAGRKVLSAEEQQYNIRQINRAKESMRAYESADKAFVQDVSRQSAFFQQNPEAFRGQPGFKETETGYELTSEYFTSLRSYANREMVLKQIEEKYASGTYTPQEIERARQETRASYSVEQPKEESPAKISEEIPKRITEERLNKPASENILQRNKFYTPELKERIIKDRETAEVVINKYEPEALKLYDSVIPNRLESNAAFQKLFGRGESADYKKDTSQEIKYSLPTDLPFIIPGKAEADASFKRIFNTPNLKFSSEKLLTGLASAEVSVEKAGLGIASGILSYYNQAIRGGTFMIDKETGKFVQVSEKYPVKLPEKLDKILNIPEEPASFKFTEKPFVYLGEAILERPSASLRVLTATGAVTLLVGQATKNIGELGLKEGTKQTLNIFSPIRLPIGKTFVPASIKSGDTKFEVQIVRIKRGGFTETYLKGKGVGEPEIKLGAYQIANKDAGVSAGIVKYPIYRIPSGSVGSIKGTQATTFLTSIKGKPSGRYGFVGTQSNVPLYTTTVFPGEATANIYKDVPVKITKVGGVEIRSPTQPEIFAFASGEIKQGFYFSGVSETGQLKYNFAKRTKVNLRGLGMDLNSPKKEVFTDFYNLGGGTTGKQILTTKDVPLVIQIPKVSSIVASDKSGVIGGLKSGVIGGLNRNQIQENVKKTQQVFKPISIQDLQTITREKTKEQILFPPETKTKLESSSNRQRQFLITTPAPAQSQRQEQKQITEQIQALTQITPAKFKTPSINIPTFNFFIPHKIPPGIGGQSAIRNYLKGRKGAGSKYTASLGAAFFQRKPIKIKQKEFERLSKVRFSGLETRPVLQIIPDKIMKGVKQVQF